MPAYAERRRYSRPRERALALAAVAAVQLVLGAALLDGLKVDIVRPRESVQRLVEIAFPLPPPPAPARPPPRPAAHRQSSAPEAERKAVGGTPGPARLQPQPPVTPVIMTRPTAAPTGSGSGSGAAAGTGTGGAAGSDYGEGAGGRDLELISGEIRPSDYPRDLGEAGIGGRVSVTFTVERDGHVSNCRVTRSSRSPELDALTCRIIEQRFRFRPSTDRYGRPIADQVDWDHDWIPARRAY